MNQLESLEHDLTELAGPPAANANFCQLVALAGLDPTADFIGADLTQVDLSGLDLREFDFSGADLRGANTEGALFNQAKLKGTKFGPFVHSSRAERVADIIQTLTTTAKQEERIARVLEAVLDDPIIGAEILNRYGKDKAKFATAVFDKMRAQLSGAAMSRYPNDQHEVTRLIEWMTTNAYPLGKGKLLFHLAERLARFPLINEVIKRSLDRSHSMYVERYRKEIEQTLQE